MGEKVDACVSLCQTVMHPLEVEEVHGGFVRMRVNKDVDLATAFSTLESNKVSLSITDYSISQCTLEQVFLKFAKDQEEETGPVDGFGGSGSSGVGVSHHDRSDSFVQQPSAPPQQQVTAT